MQAPPSHSHIGCPTLLTSAALKDDNRLRAGRLGLGVWRAETGVADVREGARLGVTRGGNMDVADTAEVLWGWTEKETQ